MTTDRPEPISIDDAWASITYLSGRTAQTTTTDHFATITRYRDGAMFITHYDGSTEWERHGVGDEIVMVIEGATTMTMLLDGEEVPYPVGPGQMIVVPQGTWHRFDSPDGVKVMTITPQPTDHHPGPDLPPA